MRLEIIGINHTTSPLEVRERAALSAETRDAALKDLHRSDNLEGVLILSTCNRTEIYLSPFHHTPEADLRGLLRQHTGLSEDEAAAAYLFRDEAAVRHLFEVAGGLDSQLLGEVQILAQVKDAYHTALDAGVTNAVLNKAFLRAIEAGKDVRRRTRISRGAVSVASASVKVAERVFGDLADRKVLLVGAGQTARLAARHLQTAGVTQWRVANRTRENAQVVADLLGGEVVNYPPPPTDLGWADVIVTATSATEPVLTRDAFKTARKKRRGMQLVLDLAVPRDSEADLNTLPDVFVYTVDDMNELARANLAVRVKEAERASLLVEEQVADFSTWYRENRVAPTIKQLTDSLEELRQREIAENARRFGDSDQEQVEAFSKALMRKVSSLMIANLKEASREQDDLGMAKAVARAVSLHNNGDVKSVLEKIDNELSH